MGSSLRAKPVGVVWWMDVNGYLLRVSQMIKMTKNFSEVRCIKVTYSRLDNPAKIFREGAARQGL